jgi:phage-related baseplate assembly protein
MTRFVATALDLSRFSGFSLVPVNFEAHRADRLVSLAARFEAQGIPYDVAMLESDPGVILQEEDAYREALDRQAINDVGRGLTLAFARGTALDLIGETYFATARLDGETDARFRRRIQLAPEAFGGAGTPGGYVYHALTADIRVKDANVWTGPLGSGRVYLGFMSTEGDGTVSEELLLAVTRYMNRDDIKLATDWLTVRRATIRRVAVKATLIVNPGPDPAAVLADARARFATEQALRHKVNAPFPRSAIMAALHAGDVVRVDVELPSVDVDPGVGGAVYVESLTLRYRTFGDE